MAKDFRTNVEIDGTLAVTSTASIVGNLTASAGTTILGNTGISTSASYPLHVSTSGGVGIMAQNSSSTALASITAGMNNYASTFAGISIRMYDANFGTPTLHGISTASLGALIFQNNANALIGTNGGTSLIFSTNSSERMRIDSAGNVTASVGNVYLGSASMSGSALATQAWVQSQGYSTGGGGSSASTGTGSIVYNTSPTLLGTVSASNITISGNLTASVGNTYLGAASVSTFYSSGIMQLNGATSSAASLQIKVTTDTQFRVANFGSTLVLDSTNLAANAYQPLTIAGSTLSLNIGGNPKFTIDSSGNASFAGNLTASIGISRFGNVGIGTTNPVAQLHVLSTNAASVGIIVQGASSQSADLQEWRNINGSAVAEISASITPLILTNVQNASNIQQWRNSSGSVLARITASGGAEFTSASVGGQSLTPAQAAANIYLAYNFV